MEEKNIPEPSLAEYHYHDFLQNIPDLGDDEEFIIFGTVYAWPEHADSLEAAYGETNRMAQSEPGTLQYCLARDPDDPTVFHMFEQYKGRKAFEAHTSQPAIQELVKVDKYIRGVKAKFCKPIKPNHGLLTKPLFDLWDPYKTRDHRIARLALRPSPVNDCGLVGKEQTTAAPFTFGMGAFSSTITPSPGSSKQQSMEEIRTLTGSRSKSPWPKTAAGLHAQLQYLLRKWRRTRCRAKLVRILDSCRPAAGWNFTKAIGFAFGSFTMEAEDIDKGSPCERSMIQLAVFLDLARLVQSNDEFEICVQDPEFTKLDIAFLHRCGVRVIHDPEAQRMMGPCVFGFAIHWGGEGELFAQCQHLQPGLFLGTCTNFLIDRDEFEEDFVRRRLGKTPRKEKPAIRYELAQHAERRGLLRQHAEQHLEVKLPTLTWRRRLVWYKPVLHIPTTAGALPVLPVRGDCDSCAYGRRNEFRDNTTYADLTQAYSWAEEFNHTGRMPRYLAELHQFMRAHANFNWGVLDLPREMWDDDSDSEG